MKDKDGDLVDRKDYEELLEEIDFIKKDLTIKNFILKIHGFIETLSIKKQEKLAVFIYLSTIEFFINNLLEMNKKERENEYSN